MALDIFVFLALGTEPDESFLNAKAQELNLPITYSEPFDLDSQSGFYPIKLNGEISGFEIFKIDYASIIQQLPKPKNGFLEHGVAYHFRYSYNHNEPTSVFYTSAILSTLEGSLVFETQEADFISTDELIKIGTESYRDK